MLVQMLWGQAPGCLLRVPRPSSAEPLLSRMALGTGLPLLLLLLWPLFAAILRRPPVPPDCPWTCAYVLGSYANCLVPGTACDAPGPEPACVHNAAWCIPCSCSCPVVSSDLTNPHSKTKFKNWESFLTQMIKVLIVHCSTPHKSILQSCFINNYFSKSLA